MHTLPDTLGPRSNGVESQSHVPDTVPPSAWQASGQWFVRLRVIDPIRRLEPTGVNTHTQMTNK